jgi:hypothetical protein
MVAGVRVTTTLARFVLLVCLTGVAPLRAVSRDADQLCGRCRGVDAGASIVAAQRGAVESISFRESVRFNDAARPCQPASAVLVASVHPGAVDPAGACVQRRRASGQSAVRSPAALRGPPASDFLSL